MNLFRHIRGVWSFTVVMVATGLQAQPPVAPPNPGLNPGAPLPPPLPPHIEYKTIAPGVTLHQTSPVLYFRGILGMSPAERARALADKSAESKKILLQKVQEYQDLPPDIREARLRQTQLRWELTSLTKLAPGDRPAFVKEAALEDRPLLDDYLHWQSLSPDGQKEFLAKLSQDRHQALTRALAQWEVVPETERQQVSSQFSQIIYLNPNQQKQTLDTFTDAERKTMELALKKFAVLPEVERRICIESFQQIAIMDPAERDEFLKNAARWEAMTASERNLWRALVQKFPIMPPSPPGLFNVVRYPPLPPGLVLMPPTPPAPAVANNPR